ncbi:DMT family transporter [Serratia rhizosphaerae]|uniref:DMT family transporter n=1 Tax=unclassified Serratia (in: enterobacteria) TaxID=2647522 RepID=UPI000CF7086E|nr:MULTISPECIES: DMT family transporter [unclassified Serratia (in: enterobacteria)]MBU3891155.1 DMT family transporter [Serratia rubidaea]AVJ17392.1 EamA family transporter [Serratia sp. MYb239]QNK30738.1 DMT family transporter [Serratia sp. JUb9]CAE1145480.1 Uncharacterized transporter YdeK [Serratia sp. Tan611]SQJ20469.1 putative DMT superfamily transporter inner membrane protein [Serratia rubidaea]
MNSQTKPLSAAVPPSGWVNGFIGMLIFSGSLPATRLAVSAFDPLFLTAIRAGIAGCLALCALLLTRQQRPARADLIPLLWVAVGVVAGFPLLTALALQHMTSAHSLVYIGLLPLMTACFAVWRGRERPNIKFWAFSVAGAALVAAFALTHSNAGSGFGDLMMLGAVALCGLGYAEGAVLSRRLGGWQTISWALTLALPATILLTLLYAPASWPKAGADAWLSLAYVSLFSMWIGFIFWYRGLAQGGIAAVGQLQLLQPFFGLLLAALLLHEQVQPAMIAVMAGVLLCVVGAKRFAR